MRFRRTCRVASLPQAPCPRRPGSRATSFKLTGQRDRSRAPYDCGMSRTRLGDSSSSLANPSRRTSLTEAALAALEFAMKKPQAARWKPLSASHYWAGTPSTTSSTTSSTTLTEAPRHPVGHVHGRYSGQGVRRPRVGRPHPARRRRVHLGPRPPRPRARARPLGGCEARACIHPARNFSACPRASLTPASRRPGPCSAPTFAPTPTTP